MRLPHEVPCDGDMLLRLVPINEKYTSFYGFKPAEQHRIADCLASLDARLSAQAQKLAALRRHKRGLMQQLFPSSDR